jgi:hypothetical protein
MRKPKASPSRVTPRAPRGAPGVTSASGAIPLEAVGPIVRWSRVGMVLTELGEATGGEPKAWPAFERLTLGVLEPARLLEELAQFATPALAGDSQARERFAAHLRRVGHAIGIIAGTTSGTGHTSGTDAGQAGCCCPSCTDTTPKKRTIAYDDGAALRPPGDAGEIFYESALSTLLVAAAAAAMARPGGDLTVAEATETIVALALDAGLLASMVRGYAEAGREGLLASLETARTAGHLAWVGASGTVVPPTMSTMGGGAPAGFDMPQMPDMPDMPDMPEVPGVPGLPGFPKIGFPKTVEERVAEILKEVRKARKWDPNRWDHKFPFWLEPVRYHDPFDLYDLACFLEVNKLLRALTEAPPAPPALAVWTTGITSVSISGACAGSTITIRGSGFGATQPANTVLLLPTLDGCRGVAPTFWSDTRIDAILPVRVSSGPVGFGDAAYIAAYNAWSARMNDLEAQLARLRCAPRKIRLVPPFGQCPPASAINVITAGTPEIVAFTANYQTVHVLEHGQPLTLRWTVKNATTVRIDRTSPSGAPFGGSTTLIPAPGQIDFAFGPQNHVTIGEWFYRLTATGVCGPPLTQTVTVVTARRPALKVAQTQITQSIQTPDHKVKMVAYKPTVLRVLLTHGLGTWAGGNVPAVTGRVRMLRSPNWSSWIDAAPAVHPMTATPGTSITVPVLPSMNNTNDTLNFILPADWSWGTVAYQVEIRVNGFGATPSFPGYSEQIFRNAGSVTYEARRTLQFRYIRVNWNGGGPPSDAVCQDTLAAAVPLLPTPSAGIAPVPGQGVHNRSSANAAQEDEFRRDMLDDFEDEHNCSAWESAWEWLGADCPDEDGAIWVLIPGQFQQGEAFDIPSNVCYTPPSNGPYAAHEISHCLNQQHVRLAPAGANFPTGGDPPSAWPNNAVLTDVPFDTRGSQTGPAPTDPRALSLGLGGMNVCDVMTYWGTPNGTWPMPRRWQQLWDYIGP